MSTDIELERRVSNQRQSLEAFFRCLDGLGLPGIEGHRDYHEIRKIVVQLKEALTSVEALIVESKGVYGLHANGDPAPWESLRTGGRFEEWLMGFDAAVGRKEP